MSFILHDIEVLLKIFSLQFIKHVVETSWSTLIIKILYKSTDVDGFYNSI